MKLNFIKNSVVKVVKGIKSSASGLGYSSIDLAKAGSFLGKLFVVGAVGAVRAMHDYIILRLEGTLDKKNKLR